MAGKVGIGSVGGTMRFNTPPSRYDNVSRARSPTVSDTATWICCTSLVMPDSNWPLVRRLNELANQLRQDCAVLRDLERRLAL